ncbi:hypothetical protein OAF66_02380 [bacterium]|nr:hypothetical protein [bacterium]MDC0550092.1 hypothetical protein [bacterium]
MKFPFMVAQNPLKTKNPVSLSARYAPAMSSFALSMARNTTDLQIIS